MSLICYDTFPAVESGIILCPLAQPPSETFLKAPAHFQSLKTCSKSEAHARTQTQTALFISKHGGKKMGVESFITPSHSAGDNTI